MTEPQTNDQIVGELIDKLAEMAAILTAASHEVEYIDGEAGRARSEVDRDMVVRRAQSAECLISISGRMIEEVQAKLWDMREPLA